MEFGVVMNKQEIIQELNRLEALAIIYSDRDRVRYSELQVQIKELEIKLLDLMC